MFRDLAYCVAIILVVGLLSSVAESQQVDETQAKFKEYAESLTVYFDENKDGRLSLEEAQKMRLPPVRADVNADGFISEDELTNSVLGLYDLRAHRLPVIPSMFDDQATYEKNFDWLIRRYDENKDGKLGQEETKKIRRPPDGADATVEADANNDGFITKDEFVGSLHKQAGYKKYMETLKKIAESLIERNDADNDKKLNKEELKKMRHPPVEADANKDGFITEAELIDHFDKVNRQQTIKTQTPAVANPLNDNTKNEGANKEPGDEKTDK